MDTIVAKAADGESARRKTIASGYLRMTKQQLDQAHNDLAAATRNLATYVRLGRVYGLGFDAIAKTVGISETRAREIVAGD